MAKLKAFVYMFKMSLTSPAYYLDVIKVKLTNSFKYFFALAMLGALIVSVSNGIELTPRIYDAVEYFYEASAKLYPEELVITLKDGNLEINQDEPFFIAIPHNENTDLEGIPANLIVFDSEGTIDDFVEYDTIMLVNDANLLVSNGRNTNTISNTRVDVYPLDEMPNGTFSYSDYQMFLDRMHMYSGSAPIILSALVILFIFMGTLFYFFVFRSIYLLVMGLFLFAVGALKGLKLNYAQYYQIALHTMTFPFVLELISIVAKVQIPFPMWFFVLNFVIGLIMVFKITENPNKPIVEKNSDVA